MATKTKNFGSVNEVLDFAIERENEAYLFYGRLADMAKKPEIVKAIRVFADEELEHKKKLEAVKAGKAAIGEEEAGNLNIANYLADVEPHPNMNYTELLTVAIKKENLSYQLYVDLAAISMTKELKDIFLRLAQEEAEHKLRFEYEYDLTTF
jgi:rubrerythrin